LLRLFQNRLSKGTVFFNIFKKAKKWPNSQIISYLVNIFQKGRMSTLFRRSPVHRVTNQRDKPLLLRVVKMITLHFFSFAAAHVRPMVANELAKSDRPKQGTLNRGSVG